MAAVCHTTPTGVSCRIIDGGGGWSNPAGSLGNTNPAGWGGNVRVEGGGGDGSDKQNPKACASAVAASIAGNQAIGMAAELYVQSYFELMGYSVTSHVTFQDPVSMNGPAERAFAVRAVVDIVARNDTLGLIHFVEVKVGNAVLSRNQKHIYPMIGNMTAVPRGTNAGRARLIVGSPLSASLNPGQNPGVAIWQLDRTKFQEGLDAQQKEACSG